MGIFEEVASGSELVGEVDAQDPMTRVKRCAYIVMRADRPSVRKLGNDKLKRFLVIESACKQVGIGTIQPSALTMDDWRWMEKLLEDSETVRLDPGPEGYEKMREQFGQKADV